VINILRKAFESITAIEEWVKLCRRMMTNLSETETIGDIRLTSTFRTLAVYTHKQDKKYAEQEESHARAL